MSHIAIRSQILTFCIGVDRHLGNLASTDRRDEVNSHDPAALGEQLLGIRCDVDVHCCVSGSKAVHLKNPTNATPLPEPVEQFPLRHRIVGSYGVATAPIWCQRSPGGAPEVRPHMATHTSTLQEPLTPLRRPLDGNERSRCPNASVTIVVTGVGTI
jgi:hypothetical protein